ncbi:MAG TPA: sigma-70 family RNA polymerase sigma factor [Terriglobales bacterium]|nr:sigma-70 family RNA polymerase sigma factor [Terriglobales bacterium]
MAAKKPTSSEPRSEANERLLVQAAQKDPAQFAELYEAHFERVYAFVARRVRERQLAEDLTSEVFHKALAALPNFNWRGIPFGVWLSRIASNVVTDQWRKSSREVVEDPPQAVDDVDPELTQQSAQLFRMVAQLPTDQRRVIGMRFAEGKSIKEIALELGRSEGAIKQLQFRGLEALRARLGGEHA